MTIVFIFKFVIQILYTFRMTLAFFMQLQIRNINRCRGATDDFSVVMLALFRHPSGCLF